MCFEEEQMITKTYIKMCRKAGEIQKPWIPGLGDICMNKVDNKEVMIIASRGKITDKEYKFVYMGIGGREQPDYWHRKDKLTLLPTQEWLQEMINKTITFNSGAWVLGYYELNYNLILDADGFEGVSAEECFIQLIMRIKYNKIWDGNNWQIYIRCL